jgi:hypothetical protein
MSILNRPTTHAPESWGQISRSPNRPSSAANTPASTFLVKRPQPNLTRFYFWLGAAAETL